MTGTLSIVELIWIIISLVASVFAARGVWRWRREDRQRKTDGLNGPLAVFYRGKIRLFSLGLTAFILCLLLGIQSALLPPRTQPLQAGYQTVLAKTLIYTAPLVIIVVIALFALALILDDRDRTLTDRAHDKKAEQRLLAIETAAKIAAERADATNAKADAAFTRADVAEQRADVAEQRADTAVYTVEGLTPRVDSAEGELGVHTGEITDHTDRLDVLEGTKERADG